MSTTASTRLWLAGWMTAWLLGALAGAAGARGDDRGDGAADAGAITIEDRTHRYQLALPEGWVQVSQPGEPGDGGADAGRVVVAGFEHPASGAVAAIARIDYLNTRAWRRRTRGAYYDEIEAGLRAATAGYKQLHARSRSLSSADVPALDLGFRHQADGKDEVVLMRLVFFRRYSLALTIRIPERVKRRHKRACEKALASFAPYFG